MAIIMWILFAFYGMCQKLANTYTVSKERQGGGDLSDVKSKETR